MARAGLHYGLKARDDGGVANEQDVVAPDTGGTRAGDPRAPSLLDALLPVVVLILLIALTILLFGIAATDGPLQVALLLSAAFAALIAFKNGYTSAEIAEAAVGGVTTAMGAIFILLAVGALIGTWNMAGTIPTVVDYGVRILKPTIFFMTTAAICAVVGMATGSSWTTAGTLGVAFIGMSKVMGLSEEIAAGAVICGAYFGDKMTPLSETTILVPLLVGRRLTTEQHIRNMFWTAGPALGISLLIFLVLGLRAQPMAGVNADAALEALEGEFPRPPRCVHAQEGAAAVSGDTRLVPLCRHVGLLYPVDDSDGVRGRPIQLPGD
jgi:NhaC family Na+:H+ antiporter